MKNKYDVIVCGAGSSGMLAAISARRNGASVLLIERYGFLGGTNVAASVVPFMTFHSKNKQVIKGICQEIIDQLVENKESLGHIEDPIDFCTSITPVNIEGLKSIYFDYIEKENIDLLLHTYITDVIMQGNRIIGIECVGKSGKMKFYASVIIDSTGDADIANYSNCDFVMGRKIDNLCQPMSLIYTLGGVDLLRVNKYIKNNPNDFDMKADYNNEYVALSGFFTKVKEAKENKDFNINRDRVLLFENVRKNEVTINMTRVCQLNGTNSFELTKAEIEGRKQLKESMNFLIKYIPGFEDAYLLSSASQIGVRETRHVVGKYIFDIDDIIKNKVKMDSIALGAFPIDIHSPNGNGLELFEIEKDNFYQIPYGVMIPNKVEGLIVTGRCISATHEANASIRVTPTVMALGQAAGTAAALSVKLDILPSNLDIKFLQKTLVIQNQIIE
jgi:hypothetical protein